MNKLLTTREVSRLIGIAEKDIIDLANANIIPHFKVAGEFLRFKKDDVVKIKPKIKKKYNIPEKKHKTIEKVRDFFYFNDFYIVSTFLIIALFWLIIKDFIYTP